MNKPEDSELIIAEEIDPTKYEWAENDTPDGPRCGACGELYHLPEGKDPTPVCHNCAQIGCQSIPALVYQRDLARHERLLAVKAAAKLNKANSMLRSAALCAGAHNHEQTEAAVKAADAVLEEEI